MHQECPGLCFFFFVVNPVLDYVLAGKTDLLFSASAFFLPPPGPLLMIHLRLVFILNIFLLECSVRFLRNVFSTALMRMLICLHSCEFVIVDSATSVGALVVEFW